VNAAVASFNRAGVFAKSDATEPPAP
jgi:hypothetical protein